MAENNKKPINNVFPVPYVIVCNGERFGGYKLWLESDDGINCSETVIKNCSTNIVYRSSINNIREYDAIKSAVAIANVSGRFNPSLLEETLEEAREEALEELTKMNA
jgi:hypothetical protein